MDATKEIILVFMLPFDGYFKKILPFEGNFLKFKRWHSFTLTRSPVN